MTTNARMQQDLTIELPMPPTVNKYWRRAGSRMHISKDGKAYRHRVMERVLEAGRPQFGSARLAVDITLHHKGNFRYDLDNFNNALLDALEAAEVFEDDSQIDELHIHRGERRKGGRAVVTISAVEVSE